MPRQERERFSATIKPCATSTPIELIWLSEISDSSVQILEQIEIPVNPEGEKWLTPVPFSLRRPMAAHLLSESPFIFRRSAPYDRESLGHPLLAICFATIQRKATSLEGMPRG
jgi:hypothetical protein